MQMRAKVADLLAAVHTVSAAVAAAPLLNVTSRVRLVVRDDGKCFVEATDYDLHATALLDCETIAPGEALPPLHAIEKVLSTFPKASTVQLTFTPGERNQPPILHVESGRSSLRMNSMAPEEWPDLDRPDFGEAVDLQVAEFRQLLESVAYARSRDTKCPALTGVQLSMAMADPGEVEITVNATDGYRLATNRATFPVDHRVKPATLILPGEVVRRILPMLTEAETLQLAIVRKRSHVGEVEQFRFTIDGATLSAKSPQEEFPDFVQIFKSHVAAATIRVDRDKLLETIGALTTVVGRSTPLVLSVVGGKLHLYAAREDEIEASMPLDSEVTVINPACKLQVGVPLHQLRDAALQCGAQVEIWIPVHNTVGVGTAGAATIHQQVICKVALDKPLPAHCLPPETEDEAA